MNYLKCLRSLLLLVVITNPTKVIGFTSSSSSVPLESIQQQQQQINFRRQPSSVLLSSSSSSSSLSYSGQTPPPPPPPPDFVPKPLPVLLGGGLFLFATSVPNQHQSFAQELLRVVQRVLRNDATIGMEFGQGVETGGIYSSKFVSSSSGGYYDQLVLQFQIEGGNAWAQGVAYGVRLKKSSSSASSNKDRTMKDGDTDDDVNPIRLVSLEVANMDASINGTPLEIIPPPPSYRKH